jgi:uncharacterized iron-regulated membrane protein
MPGDAPTLSIGPMRRLRRWHTWLVVWRVHRWLGLGLGALLILLSASGSLLVVHYELESWIERDLHSVTPPTGPASPRLLLADLARQVAPLAPDGFRLFRVMPGADENATHRILFRAPDSSDRWVALVDPWTGSIVWSGYEDSLLTSWLLGLHMHLHAGRAGYYMTGIAGVALAVLALTGIYIHRDRLTQFWRHPFRLRMGWRVAFADLHKWIGIFALYFPVMLGITGALYCLSILTASTTSSPASPFNPAQLAPIEPMFVTALEKLPRAEIRRAQIPASAGGAVSLLLVHRDAPVWQKFSRADFDAITGELRTVRAAADAPAGAQFRSMLAPLHFGLYGAPWVKWAYFVGGLAPALLAFSGAAIWWLRRRSSGKAGSAIALE